VITFDCEVLYRPTGDELAFLPEGPIQCGDGKFSWVAIQHGADARKGSLNIFDLSNGENRTYRLAGRPGFAFPTDREGSFVVGAERKIGLFQLGSASWETLCEGVDAAVEGTIINDGVVFEDGLIFGTKDLQFKEKKAGLYLWRKRDRRLIQLRSDQICSNGKVILDGSGDRVTFLDIDTPTKKVVQYTLDVAAGRLSEPEVILDLHEREDFPDGMVLTPNGASVIIAFYNPHEAPHGEARQYRIGTSELEAVWRTPMSPQVTCPLLMEFDSKVKLVLTTAVEHMPPEKRQRHSNAGCLFIGDTGFNRAPAPPRWSI
jgi:sugar lactone lactonase YvrE